MYASNSQISKYSSLFFITETIFYGNSHIRIWTQLIYYLYDLSSNFDFNIPHCSTSFLKNDVCHMSFQKKKGERDLFAFDLTPFFS